MVKIDDLFLNQLSRVQLNFNILPNLESIRGGDWGRLQGSSRSHWLRKKTSNKPMNSINDCPPHVDASVGPVDAASGQLQLILKKKKKNHQNKFQQTFL